MLTLLLGMPGLRHNPEMVYALLHRQDVFEPFRMHARFADILDNIQVGVLGLVSCQLHCIRPLLTV